MSRKIPKNTGIQWLHDNDPEYLSYKVEILSWLFWMHDFISRADFRLQKIIEKMQRFDAI